MEAAADFQEYAALFAQLQQVLEAMRVHPDLSHNFNGVLADINRRFAAVDARIRARGQQPPLLPFIAAQPAQQPAPIFNPPFGQPPPQPAAAVDVVMAVEVDYTHPGLYGFGDHAGRNWGGIIRMREAYLSRELQGPILCTSLFSAARWNIEEPARSDAWIRYFIRPCASILSHAFFNLVERFVSIEYPVRKHLP